jgi:uncharacterized SAM-binding protein YcdF (DUF218 family)
MMLSLIMLIYGLYFAYKAINVHQITAPKQIIMVVLGCSNQELQDDRVEAALQYAEKNGDGAVITYFLTGGVKNSISAKMDESSEASRMSSKIKSSNILLDELATNTAENFVYLRKTLETMGDPDSLEIVITTSEFHGERSNRLWDGVFETTPFQAKWNLSSKACPTCWADEKIHIKNVKADVTRALLILQ